MAHLLNYDAGVLKRTYTTLNIESKVSPPSAGSPSASSSSLSSVNSTRRSPRSDAEKLDTICNYMRKELRWGVSDFVKALASAEGSNNTRRKAAFAAVTYKDSVVLESYFGDADRL